MSNSGYYTIPKNMTTGWWRIHSFPSHPQLEKTTLIHIDRCNERIVGFMVAERRFQRFDIDNFLQRENVLLERIDGIPTVDITFDTNKE